MGGDLWLAQDEQGWAYADKWVCADCVNDRHLADEVKAAADTDQMCDFCEAAPAAELDVLLKAFFDGLRTEYAYAGDEGAYFEGELVATPSWSGPELVDDYAHVFTNDQLQAAVRDAALDHTWIERDFAALRHDEALRDGWKRFCHQVKFRTRHVFWLTENSPDEEFLGAGEIPAAAILHEVGQLIPQVGLLRELPAGHRLWRARTHSASDLCWHARHLGTPLPEQAVRPNRMSPAGIPLFYGASCPRTAVQEVTRHATDATPLITYAAFETTRPCTVVDFTRLIPEPSIFHPHHDARLRRGVRFLYDFVKELSANSDGLEHLEYVPTQIVTEYLLRVFSSSHPVEGLIFTSSADSVAGGGTCTVLDVPQSRCLDVAQPESDDALCLRIVADSLRPNNRMYSLA
ncbi:HEPN-associated N-terminal domain-containing protein [Streptomyces sp. NPDC050564]|uniref:HEPN-associated N-terminal domain-containing protein n=1 Tax=Streptomyces sp. NPDC050564 TaxID=3365631 RepID=UPI0037A48883